jgi:hypothetical protein
MVDCVVVDLLEVGLIMMVVVMRMRRVHFEALDSSDQL